VVEDAAIASAHTMGTGDRERADHVATEAMRTTMDTVPMRGPTFSKSYQRKTSSGKACCTTPGLRKENR
jgi:hypothetical protein